MYSPTDNNSTTTVTQTPHYYNTPTTPTDYDSAGEDSWVMTQTPPTDPLETPSPMFCDLDTISPESWILLGRPLNTNRTCVKGRKRKRRPSPSTSLSTVSIPRDPRLMIPPRCKLKLFKDPPRDPPLPPILEPCVPPPTVNPSPISPSLLSHVDEIDVKHLGKNSGSFMCRVEYNLYK